MPHLAKILSSPVILFILQLVIIIIFSRFFGLLFKRIGQPVVMGEIIAGIVLGPSVLGGILPNLSGSLFPASSMGNIQIFSQIGLILFMFIVGLELDLSVIYKKAASAIVISHASIAIPFGLGIILSYFLYNDFAVPNTPFYVFSSFIGVSMSITAFPVLSRIIQEKGMTNTRLGNIAIACAAIDDITGWCLLAIILSIVKGNSIGSSLIILLQVIIYLCIMFYIIRPILKKVLGRRIENKTLDASTLALIFVVLLLSAGCSEIIGIHFLFGAFVAGVIIPQQKQFRELVIEKIGDFALIILLPLFFVSTGLRTQVSLLNTSGLWLVCALIIFVAVLGKFGGSAISARLMKESLKDSISLGALMNTRGLVELVVLNIGYEMGILSPTLFSMMVLMAIFTTAMANPILNLIEKWEFQKPLVNKTAQKDN